MAVVIAGVMVIAAWQASSLWRDKIAAVSVVPPKQGAISNSINFVRSRVTGGVGVAVAMDSRTGLPVVGALAVDSPAQRAGLCVGDVIIKVDGIGTTGLALTQIVDQIRGFSAGSVALSALRHGTNIDFQIKRSSWNALKDKSFNPYE